MNDALFLMLQRYAEKPDEWLPATHTDAERALLDSGHLMGNAFRDGLYKVSSKGLARYKVLYAERLIDQVVILRDVLKAAAALIETHVIQGLDRADVMARIQAVLTTVPDDPHKG